MICSSKSLAFSLLIVALVAPLCTLDWVAEAQKTAANSYQQQLSQGSNQNSVYGGYGQSSGSQRQQSSLVSPVNRPRRPIQQQQSSYSRTEQQTEQQYVRQPQPQPQQPSYQQQESQYSSSSSEQAEAAAEPPSYGAVAGSPGTDFPNYARVPKTSFSCEGLPYDYGMYADEETGCQAYHVCYNGRKDSFLCGPGTVFNQRILHCDYWYSVDCGKSSQFYSSNAYMGSSQPEPGPAQAQGSYQRTQSSYGSQPSGSRPVASGSSQSASSKYNTRVQPPPQQQQIQQEEGY